MNFYVLNQTTDDVEKFFSVIPEESRPRVVSDKENPAVWDHQSDSPTVIVTDEPRTDTDAKEIKIDGQAEDLLKEMVPEDDAQSEDPVAEETMNEAADEKQGMGQEATQPLSFRDRGFKVGQIL